MIFTTAEKNLIFLYYSNSVEDTIAEIKNAMQYIDDPETMAAAHSAVQKLSRMSEEALDRLALMCGVFYGGC